MRFLRQLFFWSQTDVHIRLHSKALFARKKNQSISCLEEMCKFELINWWILAHCFRTPQIVHFYRTKCLINFGFVAFSAPFHFEIVKFYCFFLKIETFKTTFNCFFSTCFLTELAIEKKKHSLQSINSSLFIGKFELQKFPNLFVNNKLKRNVKERKSRQTFFVPKETLLKLFLLFGKREN